MAIHFSESCKGQQIQRWTTSQMEEMDAQALSMILINIVPNVQASLDWLIAANSGLGQSN